MKSKLLIGAGIILTVFIIFLIGICGASGGDKIPTEVTLKSTFENVTCEIENEENKNYDITFLTNNIQFDNQIESKNYTKIKLNQTTNFKSLGIAFMVKSDMPTSLNISLKKNDEVLKNVSVDLTTNEATNINLILENSVQISKEDEFYISFEQQTNNPFLFDTLIIFIDEV